jgi:hypothetical protein
LLGSKGFKLVGDPEQRTRMNMPEDCTSTNKRRNTTAEDAMANEDGRG